MSKKEKLLQKALTNPKDFTFQDLETLLGHLGFRRIKTNAGSHMKWKNYENGTSFRAPYHDPVKRPYLKKLTKLIQNHLYENS